jgi:thymidylate synthase ThyX
MNLRSLINFFALRTDDHAQEEIKNIAYKMEGKVLETLPNLADAITRLIILKQE